MILRLFKPLARLLPAAALLCTTACEATHEPSVAHVTLSDQLMAAFVPKGPRMWARITDHRFPGCSRMQELPVRFEPGYTLQSVLASHSPQRYIQVLDAGMPAEQAWVRIGSPCGLLGGMPGKIGKKRKNKSQVNQAQQDNEEKKGSKEDSKEEDKNHPFFVVNTTFHVPLAVFHVCEVCQKSPDKNKFDKEFEKQYAAFPYRLKYRIGSKSNDRKVEIRESVSGKSVKDEAEIFEKRLNRFFQKIQTQSFSENSEKRASQHIRVSMLLNRIKSVDDTLNQKLRKFAGCFTDIQGCRFSTYLWEPEWEEIKNKGKKSDEKLVKKSSRKKSTDKNAKKSPYEKAKECYNKTVEADKGTILHCNECQFMAAAIPYRKLREVLLKSENTRGFVQKIRRDHPTAPVYIAFLNDDIAYREANLNGVFGRYSDVIKVAYPAPYVLTTGFGTALPKDSGDTTNLRKDKKYSVKQQQFLSLGLKLDLAVRRALAQFFPTAPYYPEANTIVLVPKGEDTLPESFLESKETTKAQEIACLFDSLLDKRFGLFLDQDSLGHHFRFLDRGEIHFHAAGRFFRAPQGKKPKEYDKSSKFDPQSGKFAINPEDLGRLRNTTESYARDQTWAMSIPRALKSTGQERRSNPKETGESWHNLLRGHLKNVYKAYSPVNLVIERKNLGVLQKALMKGYNSAFPVSENKALYGTINQCYKVPVAERIRKAAELCGRAELDVLRRWVTIPPASSRNSLTSKTRKVVRKNQVSIQPNNDQKEPDNQEEKKQETKIEESSGQLDGQIERIPDQENPAANQGLTGSQQKQLPPPKK